LIDQKLQQASDSKELDKLKQTLQSYQDQLDERNRLLAERDKMIADRNAEIAQLNDRLRKLNDQPKLSKVQGILNDKVREIAALKHDLDKAKSELEKLKMNNRRFQS